MALLPEETQKPILLPEEQPAQKPLKPEAQKIVKTQLQLAVGDDIDNIDVTNLDSVKTQVAQIDFEEKRTNQLATIQDTMFSPEKGSDILAKQIKELEEIRVNQNALEERAIEKAAEPSNPYYHDLVQRNADQNEFTKHLSKLKTKAMLSNIVASLERDEAEEESGFRLAEGVDFLVAIAQTDVLSRYGYADFGDYKHKLQSKINTIYQLPDEEKAEALLDMKDEIHVARFFKDNPQFTLDLLQTLQNTENEDAWQFGWDVLEGIGLTWTVNAAAKVAKGGFKLVGSWQKTNRAVKEAARSTNPSSLADDIDVDIEHSKFFASREEQIDAQMVLRPDSDEWFSGVSPEYASKLQKSKQVLERVASNSHKNEYTREVVERINREAHAGFPGETIVAVAPDPIEGAVVVQYKSFGGAPFASKEAAKSFADEWGLPVQSINKEASGGYHIVSKITDPLNFKLNADKTSNLFSSVSIIDNTIAPLFVSLGRTSEDIAQGLIGEARSVFKQTVLPGIKKQKHYEGWSKVINTGIDWDNGVGKETGKWFNQQEFKAVWKKTNPDIPYQDKFFDSYAGFRQLNEFHLDMLNDAAYRMKNAMGLKSVDVEMPDGIKVNIEGHLDDIENITSLSTNKTPVMVLDDGLDASKSLESSYYTASAGELSSYSLNKLSETHNLIKLHDSAPAAIMKAGVPITKPARYAFVPKKYEVGGVRLQQVNNRAGGRRIWDAPYLVKSARFGRYGDDSLYRLDDSAIISGKSAKEVKEFAKKLDDVTKTAKDYVDGKITKQAADDAIVASKLHAHLAINNIDDFLRWGVDRKLFKEDMKDLPVFQGVRDGERVQLGNGFQLADDFNADELDFSGVAKLTGYRGDEKLPSIGGATTRLVDPITALSMNLDRTAKMAGFGPMKERAIQAFSKQYSQYLDKKGLTSPMELLSAHVDEAKHGKDIAKHIRNQQQYLKDLLNHKTIDDLRLQDTLERAVDWVFDSVPQAEKVLDKLGGSWRAVRGLGEEGGKGSRRAVRDTVSKDPLSRAKAGMFHSKLGLFNPASFIQQASHAVVAAAIVGPKIGFGAAQKGIIGRALIRMDDEALEVAAERLWKTGGFNSKQELIEYTHLFKALGYNNIDQSAIVMSGMQGSQLSTSFTGRTLEAGKFFFNEGELISRMTAYSAAHDKWIKNIGGINKAGKAVTHPDAFRYISQESHRLMTGMARSDLQLGLRGWKSLPTQFLSYPFRAISAMMGKHAFTPAERARMAAAYLTLAGTGGIPFGFVVEHILEKNPSLTNAETEKFLTNGIIDGALFALLDIDVNLSSRVGPGQVLVDVWKKFSEGSLVEALAGPSGQSGSALVDSWWEMITLHNAAGTLDPMTFTKETLIAIGGQVSSWSLLDRFLLARATGKLITRTGKNYGELSEGEAWAMLFGLPPSKYEDVGKQFEVLKKKKETKQDMVNRLIQLDNRYLEASRAADDKEKEAILYTKSMYINSIGADDKLRQEVERLYRQQKRNSDIESSLLKAMYENHSKGQSFVVNNILKKKQREQQKEEQ